MLPVRAESANRLSFSSGVTPRLGNDVEDGCQTGLRVDDGKDPGKFLAEHVEERLLLSRCGQKCRVSFLS